MIEIKPGRVTKDKEGNQICTSIFTRIVSLKAEQNDLLYAVPGGLIGLGTLMDPSLTKADSLVGSIIGYPGDLPEIYDQLTIEFYLLRKLVGVKGFTDQQNIIKPILSGEILLINVGSTSCGGRVLRSNKKKSTA